MNDFANFDQDQGTYALAADDFIMRNPVLAAWVAKRFGKRTAQVGLTTRMRDLLGFIKEYTAKHGVSPSYDEMRDALGIASKSGIHRLVISLERRGHIRREPAMARTIVVLP